MSENLSAAELARQMLLQDADQREQSEPATDEATGRSGELPMQPDRDEPGEQAAAVPASAALSSDASEQSSDPLVVDATAQTEGVGEARTAPQTEVSDDAAAASKAELDVDAAAASGDEDTALPPAIQQRIYSLTDQRDEALAAASEAIRAGKCIVLPTDTVYGIGANAFDARAVQALLDAKQRGRDMPPPVLIAEPELLPALVAEISESAQSLVYAFWPGALTLICNAQTGMQLDLGETGGTIAIRVPDHELTRELLRATGPLAVSSANLSGRAAATDVESAARQLGEAVEVYLDGGPTPGNMPSTIVDFSQTNTGQIIRHGALSFDQLREKAPFLTDVVNSDA